MGSKTDIDKLVEKLSFQVLAGPCNKNIVENISKKGPGTPINVRIKFRHKNDVHRGVISVPKLVFAKTHEKLRLVSSDQTIMSFNFLMDTAANKKIMKKTQKRIFQLFRPGVCLGTHSDDDDYPYMANSHVNIKSTTSVTKPEINDDNKRNFGLKKNITIIQPFDESIRPPKIFLGKCKPGGCLDPPYGEEKYVYGPVLVKSDDKINQRYLNQNELQKSSLITYPSMTSCTELKVRNERLEISHKMKEESHITPPNTYAYLQSYYIPTRSKEISVSSYSGDVEKNTDIENERLYSKRKKIVSGSKDSILTPTGCPVEPVLPTSVNLSPIQSNNPTLQNNVKYFEGLDNTKYIRENMNLESDNISEKITHVSNILPQSQIIASGISNNFKIKEHINIISNTNKNEECLNFQGIGNIQKSSVEDGDKPNGVVHKHSIIIIAPIKNSADINDNKKYTEPELQNKFIKNSQTLSTEFIPIKSDIDLEVLQLKGRCSSSINKLNTHFSGDYLEDQNSSSLLTENIIDISNTKNNFRDNGNESEIGENFNISELKSPTISLDKKILSSSVDVNINKSIIESSAEFKNVVPITTSSLNEKKLNIINHASNTSLSIKQTPFQECSLNIEKEEFIQEINAKHMKLLSRIYSSQRLSKTLDFQSSGTTLSKQLNQISKAASEVDSHKSNFEMNSKETENVLLDSGSRKNIKSLEKKSSEISAIPNEFIIQSENKKVMSDDRNIEPMIKKSLGFINYDITNEKLSDINNKKIVEIYSFKNEPLNSFTSISNQSTFILKKSHEKIISDLHSSHTAFNIVKSNSLKELEQAPNYKDLTETNLIENIENKQEEVNTSPGTMNYDITNKKVSEISNTEIDELKSFENASLHNHKSSIKSILSRLTLNKNHENVVINKSIDPILRTTNDLNLSQTAFNMLNTNSLIEKVSNSKHFTDSNRQTKLSNLENSNSLLELEQAKAIKSLKKTQDSNETGYIKKEHSEPLQTHKNVLKKDLFYFDIALQMHINNNKQMIFKTVDSTKTSKMNKEYSLLSFKSEITANDDEMKIPIDSNTEILLRVKRKLNDKSEIGIKGNSFLTNKPECDTKQENTNLYNIQDTISSVYEQYLVPIETMLRALKEEVDVLVRNQILIREMLKVNKTMPARLVHANRKCACHRM